MRAHKALVLATGICLALGTLTTPHAAAKGKGPDPNGPAKAGLCNAYFAGQGKSAKKQQSTAFKRLVGAAGGSANVREFCADVATPKGAQRADADDDQNPNGKPAKKPNKPKKATS